jgi:hypothetical protein
MWWMFFNYRSDIYFYGKIRLSKYGNAYYSHQNYECLSRYNNIMVSKICVDRYASLLGASRQYIKFD